MTDASGIRAARGWVREHHYGARGVQVLDLHLPARPLAGSAPLVIAVHGGAWYTGDRALMRTTAEGLAVRGVAVASIEYRQRQPDPVGDMIADIAEAVGWARRSAAAGTVAAAGADGPLVLLGDSAGAHAAVLGVLDGRIPAPDALVSLCGALDLAELSTPRDDEQRERFAGYRATLSGGAADAEAEAAALARIDPARVRVARGRGAAPPPLLAATSAADFFRHATLGYVRVARGLGDEVALHEVGPEHPECRHSWQLDASLAETDRLFDLVTQWIGALPRS